MKIKLNQIVDAAFGLGQNVYYSLYAGNDSEKLYCIRTVEVEVPDLPDEEFIKSFVEAKNLESREMRMQALRAELKRLEAGE